MFPVFQAFVKVPFLFSIFINALRSFLNAYALKCITCNINYEDIAMLSYFKIFISLFADDTVWTADSDHDLQYTSLL